MWVILRSLIKCWKKWIFAHWKWHFWWCNFEIFSFLLHLTYKECCRKSNLIVNHKTDFFYFHQKVSYRSDSFWKIFISHYFETITATLRMKTLYISLYKTSATSTYAVTVVKLIYYPCYYPAITSYHSAITRKSENKKILPQDNSMGIC